MSAREDGQGERELSPSDLLEILRRDPHEGVHSVLLDRNLYLAALLWYRKDRRGLFRALEEVPVFAQRIIGYGLYLLGGGEGDPLPAWEPFGVWILTTRAGWEQFLHTLQLTREERATLHRLESSFFPWGRRFAVLAYLIEIPRYQELRELLHLASQRGGFFTRLLARGTCRMHGLSPR